MAHAADHQFFVPAPSVWPAVICLGALLLALGFAALVPFQNAFLGWSLLGLGGFVTLLGSSFWLGKTITESRQRGFDAVPEVLDMGNRYGIIFFIISEVMFFAAFFAAFFYLSQWAAPGLMDIGRTLDINLPIINTLLLLTSGVTITAAHHALLENRLEEARNMTIATWVLGVIFLGCQVFEYQHVGFGMDGGLFASLFYMMTGFHGFHVLLGTIMLMVASKRLWRGDFTPKHHFYFEATAWYWHFVDVVWIGLFLFVYVL